MEAKAGEKNIRDELRLCGATQLRILSILLEGEDNLTSIHSKLLKEIDISLVRVLNALKRLTSRGIVSTYKKGNRRFYYIPDENVEEVEDYLKNFFGHVSSLQGLQG